MTCLLTDDALQRSTYLNERDCPGAISDYGQDWGRFIALSRQLAAFIKSKPEVKVRLNSHASKNKLKQISECGVILERLVECVTKSRKNSLAPRKSASIEDIINSEPYYYPFSKIARVFYCSLVNDPRLTSNTVIATALTKWYLSRLAEASRYVMHLSFLRSKLPYSAWCARFDTTEWKSNPWHGIAEEFPVLIRIIYKLEKNYSASIYEMLDRLHSDRELIKDHFDIALDDRIENIEIGLSDPHQGGRTVMRIFFRDSGAIVYKPKSIDLDSAFHGQSADTLSLLGIRPLKVLKKNGYGWVENVDILQARTTRIDPRPLAQSSTCFWLLNSSDLHLDNIIPTNEGILPIDLETLLTAPLSGSYKSPDPLWRNHSIYMTLLFDCRISDAPKPRVNGFNYSELGIPYFSQPQFLLQDDQIKLIPGKNIEIFSGNSSLNYSSSLSVKIIQEFIIANNDFPNKKLLAFLKDLDDHANGRVVFRDTILYSRILERIRQPRFLRDGALLSLDLLSLHTGVSNSAAKANAIHEVIDDEIDQLLNSDIPYFSMQVGAKHIQTSKRKIQDFFSITAKDFSISKILAIEASDILEQKELIKLAIKWQRPKKEKSAISSRIIKSFSSDHANKIKIKKNIQTASTRLLNDAFCPADAPARWISMLGDVSANEIRIDIGDSSFFSGSLGIITALQAAELAIEPKKTSALSQFLNSQAKHWTNYLSRNADSHKRSGYRMLGIQGLGGELFAFSTLTALNQDRWKITAEHIESIIEGVEVFAKKDHFLDFTSGIAGLAIGCESFLRLNKKDMAHTTIHKLQRACVQRLLDTAEHDGLNGLAWTTPADVKPLLGYAHGWSGIVVALKYALKRAKKNDAVKIQHTIENSALFPDSLLATGSGWIDYREGISGEKRINRSWCNGIPGFLRGMLCIRENWTALMQDEFERSIYYLNDRLGSSDSYRFCCGEFGSVDLLLDMHENDWMNKNSNLLHDIEVLSIDILTKINSMKETFIPEIEFPSLYQGKGGILYTACRILNRRIPSLSCQYLA